MANRRWNREESLLVLHLYCLTPFGKLHHHNPEIIQLAQIIDRTPSSVAMKACNFANLDPGQVRKGLSSVSQADRELWHEFLADSKTIALTAQNLYETRVKNDPTVVGEVKESIIPDGPSETVRQVMTRRLQGFFRKAVLTSYDNRCAISGLKLSSLLVASHIIPWKDSEPRRADPTNGIALNHLYDAAFDKGYLTFDEDWRVCLSNRLKDHFDDSTATRMLFNIEGNPIIMPARFRPDEDAMAYHRNHCFEKFMS